MQGAAIAHVLVMYFAVCSLGWHFEHIMYILYNSIQRYIRLEQCNVCLVVGKEGRYAPYNVWNRLKLLLIL